MNFSGCCCLLLSAAVQFSVNTILLEDSVALLLVSFPFHLFILIFFFFFCMLLFWLMLFSSFFALHSWHTDTCTHKKLYMEIYENTIHSYNYMHRWEVTWHLLKRASWKYTHTQRHTQTCTHTCMHTCAHAPWVCKVLKLAKGKNFQSQQMAYSLDYPWDSNQREMQIASY